VEVVTFTPDLIPAAAQMFAASAAAQRQAVPAFSPDWEDPARTEAALRRLLEHGSALAALEDGHLAGYLGWFHVNGFRHTARRAAYCPAWAHVAPAGLYRQLYSAASGLWAAAGCDTHAITLLAQADAAREVWFWQGFGLLVVDGVRPLAPLAKLPRTRLTIRRATLADAGCLAELDAEHVLYYTRPPIQMPLPQSEDAAAFEAFLSDPANSIWLAEDEQGRLAGFMRFDGRDYGGADVASAEQSLYISGAYLKPEHRGSGAGAAMLDAGLRHGMALGYARCGVDFESFNPDAAVFWMKHFQPVCYSLLRVPETMG